MSDSDRARLTAIVAILVATLVVAMAASSAPPLALLYPESPLEPASTWAAPTPTPTPSSAAAPPSSSVLNNLASTLPAVLAFVISLIVLVLVLSVRAQQRKRTTPLHSGDDPAAMAAHAGAPADAEAVVADSLDRLRAGAATGDEEIIRCWRALESSGAAAGVVRQPTETVAEYVRDLSSATKLDEQALGQLARLYRAAVYSGRSSSPVDRDTAVDCLARLTPGLEKP